MEKIDIQTGTGYYDLDLFIQMNNYIIDIFFVTDEPKCPTANIRPHTYYELNYFVGGNVKITCNNMTHSLSSGGFVLIPPNTEYSILSDPANPPRKLVTAFVIDQVDISKINPNTQMYQDDYNALFKILKTNKFVVGHVTPASSNTITSEFDAMISEFNGSYEVVKEYRKDSMAQNLIQELGTQVVGSKSKQSFFASAILIDFLRACTKKESTNVTQQKPLTPYWLKYSIGVIIENDCKDITLDSLAARLKMSSRQVQRYLSKYYHMTFKEMLSMKRIQKAKEMLAETDLSIDEIGADVGFKSKNYFYKKFKEETGVTPIKFKNSL